MPYTVTPVTIVTDVTATDRMSARNRTECNACNRSDGPPVLHAMSARSNQSAVVGLVQKAAGDRTMVTTPCQLRLYKETESWGYVLPRALELDGEGGKAGCTACRGCVGDGRPVTRMLSAQ